ncbi:hypothetical protein AmDm5_2955 [Acetobacter malorum]|nr:hypothetical protein AmDm5_2955 [Acetobacter malorum]
MFHKPHPIAQFSMRRVHVNAIGVHIRRRSDCALSTARKTFLPYALIRQKQIFRDRPLCQAKA